MKFLSALAADGTIPDVEGIISSNLSVGFDSLKQNVTESMATQERVMAAVQVCTIFLTCEQALSGGHPLRELARMLHCSLQSAFSLEASQVINPKQACSQNLVAPSRLVPILLAILVLISCPACSFRVLFQQRNERDTDVLCVLLYPKCKFYSFTFYSCMPGDLAFEWKRGWR